MRRGFWGSCLFLSALFFVACGNDLTGPGNPNDPWSNWPGPGEKPSSFNDMNGGDAIVSPDGLFRIDFKWATPHIPGGTAKLGDSVLIWTSVKNDADNQIWMNVTAVDVKEENPVQPGRGLSFLGGGGSFKGFDPKREYKESLFGYYAQGGDGRVIFLRFCVWNNGTDAVHSRPPNWCADRYVDWTLP